MSLKATPSPLVRETHVPRATRGHLQPASRTTAPGNPVSDERAVWGAVAIIIGALFAGVACAVGHDRYNNYLDGEQVRAIAVSQDWVVRIGTAFAFIVKMFLAAAVAASYTQRLWHSLRARVFEVRNVDTLVAAPTDLKAFVDWRAWSRAPGLMTVGLIIWCLPLAAVVTPGTLTVVYSPVSHTIDAQVPQLSYNWSTWASAGPNSDDYSFWSASADVQRAGFAAATTGRVLSIPHQDTNQSYHLSFHGPAIQCSAANASVREAANQNAIGLTGSGGHEIYWSWVGNDDHGWMDPHGNISVGTTWKTLDTMSEDAARIFVWSATSAGSTDGVPARRDNVTECLLYNASYSVDFNIQQGNSYLDVLDVSRNEKLPTVANITDLYGDASRAASLVRFAGDDHYAYQAVMDVFGKLLVGSAYAQNFGANVIDTSFQRTYVDWDDFDNTQRDLEELFQNMTLSMFSSAGLLLNSTQAAWIPVTVTIYPLSYTYAPRDLWISYGAAILVTLAAALSGLHAIWMIHGSYSSKFSTCVRVAKSTGLDRTLDDHDDGADPLPRAMAESRLRVNGAGHEHL